jgi:hypothetical protein
VDVGDVDIAGISALAARRFGASALLAQMAEQAPASADFSVGMAPVMAGISLA